MENYQSNKYNPYKIDAPTLMIGLGGLGSSIINNVYKALPDNYKRNTVAHIFDTDVAELKAEQYADLLNGGGVTQISPPLMVADCIERLKDSTSVEQWFPAIGSLDHKQMVKGASQVRTISRLALLDTINSGRINSLNHNIDKLLRLTSEGLKDSIRVVIVNSLAGGTGSGAFLQIALYVREYLERRHQFKNATFRSFLIMPEIFINNGDYTDGSGAKASNMERTVRANGYACFKELDALIRQRGGVFNEPIKTKIAPLFPIALEYMPGKNDKQIIESGAPPFDVVTVFDYTGMGSNENIANLGNKGQYIRQVEDAIRLHLFSPIEGRGGAPSREDNLANLLLASGDRARYAGCGSAAIEYPFDDIARYIALRWVDDGISKQWRELDETIDDEIRRVLNNRAQGIHAPMPKRQTLFCQLLRENAEQKNPAPFYKAIYDQAHELDEKGWRTEAKHKNWIRAVNKRLEEVLSLAVKEKSPLAGEIFVEDLVDYDKMVNEVRESEQRIKHYADELNRRIQTIGVPVGKDIVWRAYNQEVDFEHADDTQLNTWILGKDSPMHPLAIRYFMGESKQAIDKIIKKLEKELQRAEKQIDNYYLQWDHPDTKELEETAVEKATVVKNKPLASWRKGLLKDFAYEYQSKRRAMMSNLQKRAECVVFLDAYRYLQGCLDDFLQYWERWFEYLDSLSDGVQQELGLLASKHDNAADRTKIYVRASSAIKEALWDKEGILLTAEEVPTDISREIYLDFYRKKGNHYQNGIPSVQEAESFIEGFSKNVLGWCESFVRQSPTFNMNVSEAIQDEFRLLRRLNRLAKGLNEEKYLQQYLGKLERLALPWVLSSKQPQRFAFTCLTPAAAESWGQKIVEAHIHSPMINEGFSTHKITRMSLLYGLSATDLNSVADIGSQYQLAYQAHLAQSRQRPPKAYTPHLDRYWDSPAFLPEIHDDEQIKRLNDVYRAVLYTLAEGSVGKIGVIFKKQYDTEWVWHESPQRGEMLPVLGHNEEMLAGNTYGMICAFACNYDLVEKALTQAEADEQQQRNTITNLALLKKITDIIHAFKTLTEEAPSATIGANFREALLFALVDEVQDIFYRIHDLPNTAFKESETYLMQLLDIAEQLLADGHQWGNTLKLYVEGAIHSPKY